MQNELVIPLALLLGIAIGVGVALWLRARSSRLAQRLQDADRAGDNAALLDRIKTEFDALSRKVLSENADDFLKLARAKLSEQTTRGDELLDAKKRLIDARLAEMNGKLSELNALIQRVDRQRAESTGAVQAQLQSNARATQQLQTTASQLREALANPQRRGQWGERMAEDVLRLAGLVEGINYEKQSQLRDGGKPDFAFLLPDGKRVHMDVKFPLDNYLRVLDAEDETMRATAGAKFLRDVRNRIKEVTSRVYIDPAASTVDYMLVFIPNEQVYGFIHENDPALLDDALRCKVVLCSPLTLYAILAVIRKAVDNFHFEQHSKQILGLLAEFKKQWGKYVDVMDKMGKKIEEAARTYEELKGTRTRQLERQLDRIDDIQTRQISSPQDPNLPPATETPQLGQPEAAGRDG